MVNDRQEIIQKIKIYENSKYAREENLHIYENINCLKENITKSNEEINNYYEDTFGKNYSLDEIINEHISNMRILKRHEVIVDTEIDGYKIKVSNFGYLKDENDNIISMQENPRGWLQINEAKYNKTYWRITKYKYIFQIIADTFLVKRPCYKCTDCPIEVHHISNDGYDNSVWNLIYLNRCEHKKVHGGG